MENNQIAVIAVVALLLSVVGLGAVAYTYTTDSDAQAIGISRRVSTYNIIDDAVTNAKMADNSIDSADYVDGSIDNAHLSDDSINSSQIIDDTIDSSDYAAVSIDNEHLADDATNKSQLDYEVVAVTVTAGAGNTVGTGTCTAGSIVIGYYPTSNQDQLVDSVGVSSTTVTVTLNAAATLDNVFNVVLLKA